MFNRELVIDLMRLNNKPVVHIVQSETGFRNSVFITDKTAENLWVALVNCWEKYKNVFQKSLDLIENPASAPLNLENAEEVGMNLQFSVIEAHNLIGQVEGYYHPFRRVFNVINDTHHIAIKAINGTMGPKGLVA